MPKIQLHLPIMLIWWKAFISSDWNESSWMCSPIQNALLYYSPYIHSITHTNITLLHRWIDKLLIIIIIIKLRWALFVTYTIIQSITSSEMCSLHLTHPSAHTLGAVVSRHSGARGAIEGSVPCSRVSPQSWTIPAGAEIRVTSPTLYLIEPRLPPVFYLTIMYFYNENDDEYSILQKRRWIAVQMNMLVMKVDARSFNFKSLVQTRLD